MSKDTAAGASRKKPPAPQRPRLSRAARVRERASAPEVMSGTGEAIVDATIMLLREQGAGAISTRNIATRTNVNQALVHYYFGSMELLMVPFSGVRLRPAANACRATTIRRARSSKNIRSTWTTS